MLFFVRAVVTGFGLSLGAALFKKHVQHRLGLDEDPKAKKADTEETTQQGGGTDPHLRNQVAP